MVRHGNFLEPLSAGACCLVHLSLLALSEFPTPSRSPVWKEEDSRGEKKSEMDQLFEKKCFPALKMCAKAPKQSTFARQDTLQKVPELKLSELCCKKCVNFCTLSLMDAENLLLRQTKDLPKYKEEARVSVKLREMGVMQKPMNKVSVPWCTQKGLKPSRHTFHFPKGGA